MSKFKVGDRVRSTYGNENFVGTIVRCNYESRDDLYVVDFPDKQPSSHSCPVHDGWEYAECFLAKVEESHKFKVGDKVIIKQYWSHIINRNVECEHIGKTGIITEFIGYTKPDNIPCFNVDINGYDLKCYERDLELVNDGSSNVCRIDRNGNFYMGDLCGYKTYCDANISLKNNKQFNYKNMNLLEKIKFNLKSEPLKTLIKNGIRQDNGDLTDLGLDLFDNFLEEKFKAEFDAAMIAEIKKQEEEEAKK